MKCFSNFTFILRNPYILLNPYISLLTTQLKKSLKYITAYLFVMIAGGIKLSPPSSSSLLLRLLDSFKLSYQSNITYSNTLSTVIGLLGISFSSIRLRKFERDIRLSYRILLTTLLQRAFTSLSTSSTSPLSNYKGPKSVDFR